jgi:hypothetical protein
MKFDPTVTLGNSITIVTFLVLSVLAWRDLNWRVKILEIWKSTHEHTAEERERNIGMLREAIVKIEALANGQDRRLQLLEDWMVSKTFGVASKAQ